MIKLIVGLGNPGHEYERTRHNVGFLFLDRLASELGAASWGVEPRFKSMLSNCVVAGSKLILLKPQTFMNRSGLAVGSIARYYKIAVEDILVVHDELDLPVGVIKLKTGGGHAGHNGLRDIVANLGSHDFHRLRIGIGRPFAGKKVADFVLSSPSEADFALIDAEIDVVIPLVNRVVEGDVSVVMNFLNSKKSNFKKRVD